MIVGITFGAFDLLHPGHLYSLYEAKTKCDELIVGLHTDPSVERISKNKPVQTTYERYLQLASCKYVNCILPYDTEQDICNILHTFADINKYFLGEEYKDKEYTGKQICIDKGIEVIFLPRKHSFSSTELRNRLNV